MSFDMVSPITQTALQVLGTVLTHLHSHRYHVFDAGAACVAAWILLWWLRTSRQRLRTTQLRGPPSESFIFGVGKRTLNVDDAGATYEAWARKYGSVYSSPFTLGSSRVVLCDPKAIAHFFSKESWTYIQTPFAKKTYAKSFGKGLFWAHGEDHKRQRKSLTPAFSIAAIRHLTSVFYDSAYKAKGAWDTLIQSSGGDSAVIDVQNWMNHISLDTIGIAGFSHNFGALEGKRTDVTDAFDTFSASPRNSTLNTGLFLLAQAFPFLMDLPTPRAKLTRKLNAAVAAISNELLARTRKEMELGVIEGKEEKSVIGLLIKGANSDSEFRLTQEEVISQMHVLILAGYETMSLSLTWALLELSRNPDVQTKLRNELLELGADPTYDQLSHGLPYLDAVVHECLRVHSPTLEITRIADCDDTVPLSQPIRTKSGEMVDSLTIAKGTLVMIPVRSVNRSVALWGKDAKFFRPSRWLEDAHGANGIPTKVKELPGHRHLLSLGDGPKMCLGKNFAITEFKAVLTVLVKNFVIELRDGPDTKIETGRGLFLVRPKIAGEVGCKLPLRVRPYV